MKQEKNQNQPPNRSGWTLWLLLALMVILIVNVLNKVPQNEEQVGYSQFREYVRQGLVAKATIRGQQIHGEFKNDFSGMADNLSDAEMGLVGKKFRSYAVGTGDELTGFMEQHQTEFSAKPEERAPFWQQLLLTWLPMIALVVLFLVLMRQIQVGGGKALSFGKSRARLLTEDQQKVTFQDVAGVNEAKQELEEIIAFLKDPKKFTRLGGRIPKGVLLVGPPGTGKTLLAKAIAGEAGVPFFSISGSDFVEMFVGVGASRVRDLFEQGKRHAPCIIFIDEIDAVGRQRGAGWGGGHDEREQTLNQLLVEMDGFDSKEGVILIAATNRPDVLDSALLRPGRFDRRIVVPAPDVNGRHGILKVHTRKMPLADDTELEIIARGTPGFCGADLENLVNEAALIAARHDKSAIGMEDLEMAKDKVLMGSERRSLVISEDEKKTTAYHEAGHAMVARLLPGTDPVHKVTIIPRGIAMGLTQLLPSEEKHSVNQEFAENQIAYIMGGRAAEEIVFGQKTTGAGNDLEKATELARRMVCEWGMSEKLGPLALGKHDDQVFLGRDFAQRKEYSERTAEAIDSEVRRIATEAYDRAHKLLTDNVDVLHAMANALLEYEVLDGQEVDLIMKGERINKPKPVEPKAKSSKPEGEEAEEKDEKLAAKRMGEAPA